MSAFALTDVGTQILNAGILENMESIKERGALRAGIPLPILVNSVARFLQKTETETAVFIQSLPNIDLERLDPDHRDCAICWNVFKLQSKSSKLSSPFERDSTPLQLPCAHIICKACIQGWLPKSGTCPFCRHQCTRREFLGNEAALQRELRRRESYKAFVELAPLYLATIKPRINTYGEFAAWAFIDEPEIPSLHNFRLRILRMRAKSVIGNFNRFQTTLEERMLQGPDGRRLLMKLRAALAAGVPTKVIDYSEDEQEEQSDEEGDSTEEGDFEGLAYADDVLEEYGSTDEEEEPADDEDDDDDNDGGEFLDESEDAATSTAAAETEEEEEDPTNDDHNGEHFTDESEDAATSTAAAETEEEEEEPTHDDHNGGQFTDESEDAAVSTAAAAVAAMLEEVVKDLVNEDRDDHGGNVELGATEIEKEKKSRSVSLLGCAALISMGLAILMTSRLCTHTC